MEGSRFPVVIRTPEQTYTESRVSVQGGILRAWWAPNGAIEQIMEGEVIEWSVGDGRRPATEYLVLVDGAQLVVSETPANGCGCSHPLRRVDPTPLPHTIGT